MSWLGLDIGGANLKAADGRGWASSEPFALWREPEQLTGELEKTIRRAPEANRLAVTMTGELCDCFRTKAEGIRHILAAVRQAALSRDVWVYRADGRFVDVEDAGEQPRLTAASNWRATAEFACRYVEGRSGILIDVGSTTTDIVPLVDGHARPRGLNDTERLLAGELVYSGVCRTPICALTYSLPWHGQPCPVAAEFFSTTADAYVLLGLLPEEPCATWTADGRPLTAKFARERLARMVCADSSSFTSNDGRLAAEYVVERQLDQLRVAVTQATGAVESIECAVICGAGEFLASRTVRDTFSNAEVISLAGRLGPKVSKCGPAHALAVLAAEEFGP
jgi:(4-(4-[2-(gamma-L-glutamylamino)ethyl]phenoxymethyl)furan-2-yl)methanamine synthase